MIKTTANAIRVFLHGALRDGNPAPIDVDNISSALVIVDHAHHKLHDGYRFGYCDAITLGVATQDYLLVVPNTTLWPHFTYSFDGTAITSCAIYEGTDRTGTTLQTSFNKNRNSPIVAGMAVYKGTSGGTTDGTMICNYASGMATGNGSNFSVAGGGSFSGERILKQNTKYIIRLTSGTAGNLCNMDMDWYEHTSDNP